MTQKDLKDKIGCSMGLVGSWASNRASPSYEKCLELIKAGITLTELFNEEAAEKVLENSTSNADLTLNKIKELETRFSESERLKIKKADYYFQKAKECLETQNIEEINIGLHFSLLANHYSILMDIKKELDYKDLEHLDDLNNFIEKKYIKKYLEGNLETKNFQILFYLFVSYCHTKAGVEKKYFEKALEVQYNLKKKIIGESKSFNEYKSEYVKKIEEEKKRLQNDIASKNSWENEYPVLCDLDLGLW